MWNFAGAAIPVVAAVICVPVVVRHLSAADFGLLGIAWAALGYFSLLDLGMGRATTRYVAAAMAGRDSSDLGGILGISVLGQAALGVAGGLLLGVLVPWIAHGPLGLSGRAARDAVVVLELQALSVPIVLVAQALRAALEGAQRFALVNLIRAPSGALAYVVGAVAAASGVGVRGIVALMVATRVATCWATWVAVRRVVPARPTLRWGDRRLLREVAVYSGWVAVSNLLSPLLVYAERFVLGAVSGLAAVAYYTPPAEGATRLLLVPGSVATALFPRFSAADRRGERRAARSLASRAALAIALLLVAPILLGIVFAPTLLTLWLGPTYAAQGALVLRILLAGVFANALAHIPHSYLQASGRPDLTAKIHLAEVPVYLVMVVGLVHRFGLPGAAAAWTLRVLLDAALLFVIAGRASADRGAQPG